MNDRPAWFSTTELQHGHEAKKKVCDEVGKAIDGGSMGQIVAKHEELILHYYTDVQSQANFSFAVALIFACVGFVVFIGTLVCAIYLDMNQNRETATVVTIAGVVSGFIIEAISAMGFWLYSRGARQFGAFHVCLERTHRYLLAYKIAEQIGQEKDSALRDLVATMANAPMITFDPGNMPDPQPIKRTAKNEKDNDKQ